MPFIKSKIMKKRSQDQGHLICFRNTNCSTPIHLQETPKNDHSTYTFRNFKTHITIAPTTSNDHTVDERNVIHFRLTNNSLQPATYYGN